MYLSAVNVLRQIVKSTKFDMIIRPSWEVIKSVRVQGFNKLRDSLGVSHLHSTRGPDVFVSDTLHKWQWGSQDYATGTGEDHEGWGVGSREGYPLHIG